MVSRWDLGVVDADALLAAGRAAHQRNRPEEDEQDAVAAVANPAHALYALAHERGEPWYEFPGVEVGYGARVYLQLDTEAPSDTDAPSDAAAEEAGGEEGEDFDPVQAVLPPPGRVLFSEDYA